MQANPVEASFGIGKVATFTAEQIDKEFGLKIKGLESLEIELFNEALNLDGQLPENIERDYLDMANSITPFLVYGFGGLMDIKDPQQRLKLFSDEQVKSIAETFALEGLQEQYENFPDNLHHFLKFEKGFTTMEEVQDYLKEGMTFEDLAIAICTYSSNILPVMMERFAAKSLNETEEWVASQIQDIIHRDFEVKEIYIRGSIQSKQKQAHNVGSFVQLSRAYQKLLSMYETKKNNQIVQTVFESMRKRLPKEYLERTYRIQEIGYIFNQIPEVKIIASRPGLNIRQLDAENSGYLALKNGINLDKYSYRRDISSEDHPKALDALVHICDFAVVEVGGEKKLVSYMKQFRVRVKLDPKFIDELKSKIRNMDNDNANEYVLQEFMKIEYVYARLVKQMLVKSLRKEFGDKPNLFKQKQ